MKGTVCSVSRMVSSTSQEELKVGMKAQNVSFTYFANGYCNTTPELVITSGGKNIAPVPIENEIKESVPFLSNVMVVGDHRKYISCLVTLKVG